MPRNLANNNMMGISVNVFRFGDA